MGGCHAAGSQSLAEAAFVGETSASIDASNAVFGDPCGGTVKWLYIQATYSAILPLKMISFSVMRSFNNQADLTWLTENEINTSQFLIERSYNGSVFEMVDSIAAKPGNVNSYRYTADVSDKKAVYFRLKIIDADLKAQYSSIVQLAQDISLGLEAYPNPATDQITISGTLKSEVRIINNNGKEIKKFVMNNGNEKIDITSWPAGIYYVRSAKGTIAFLKN